MPKRRKYSAEFKREAVEMREWRRYQESGHMVTIRSDSTRWYDQITAVMVGLLLCIACQTIAARAVPRTTHQAMDLTAALRYEGIERSYHIHLPPGFSQDRPAPLVFALHGGGGVGFKFNQSTTQGTLSDAADKRGVVLVFPEGVNKHWCDGRPEVCRTKKTYDDVGFISRITDVMVKNYGIDPGRVYATGISNGGFMSVRLAMDLSDKIAAVAPVAAQMAKVLKDKRPQQPVSVMIVNGTEDPIVPFGGGHVRLFRFGRSRGEVLSTAATVKHFRRYNGCDKAPEKSKLQDKDPNDGTSVEIEKYRCARDGTEVVLVKVTGGGHTWPGGNQYLKPRIVGAVSREINAGELILDFFLRHSRREEPASGMK